MRIVSPYKPFRPESVEHLNLGAFDWCDALLMLEQSARRFSGCGMRAITDGETTVPVKSYRYDTTRERLMLWIIEVCLRYLESDDFDQDTVMVCPDILVLGDLRPFFQADLGLIVRFSDKHLHARPLLNSVQWWRVAAKARLVAFYGEALRIADGLSDELIRWGADTVPLLQLVEPLEPGILERSGLTVATIDQASAMSDFSASLLKKIELGQPFVPSAPLLDFRYLRKHHMRSFFDTVLGSAVAS